MSSISISQADLSKPSFERENVRKINNSCKKTLLIVDDDPGPRLSLNMVFSDQFHTLVASSVREAISLINEYDIQISIIDLNLPDRSGIEILKELKKVHPCSETILFSGYLNLSYYRQAFKEKVFECIHKPIVIQELREAVDRATDAVDQNFRVAELQGRIAEAENCLEIYESKYHELIEREKIYAQMTHELNSSLSGVAGYFDVISQRLPEIEMHIGADSEVSKSFSHFSKAVQSGASQLEFAVNLSRRYLQFLSLPANELHAFSEVHHIQEELKRTLCALNDFSNVELKIVAPEDNLYLKIHPIDLLQVITNLARNASQSTTSDIQLTIEIDTISTLPKVKSQVHDLAGKICENDSLTVNHWWLIPNTSQSTVDWAEICVSDTGPGVSPEAFMNSHTESNSSKFKAPRQSSQGWGIGLKIVERVLTDVGAGALIESCPGKGTSFRLFIPLEVAL
jgi:signal transduction histidine kinase